MSDKKKKNYVLILKKYNFFCNIGFAHIKNIPALKKTF